MPLTGGATRASPWGCRSGCISRVASRPLPSSFATSRPADATSRAWIPRSAKFAFGFRMPGGQVCLAAGRVLRVDRAGFAAILSRSTDAFDGFVERLSGRP